MSSFQGSFHGPRKPSGGYQVPPNQGIGRYGASFGNSSNRPNITNSQSQAPAAFRSRAPNAPSAAAKALRYELDSNLTFHFRKCSDKC